MSDPNNVIDVGGHTAKEYALFILLGGVIVLFGMGITAFVMAILNPETNVILTGSIDLTLIMGLMIGIGTAAVVFVGQQLNSKQMSAATRQSDDIWMAESGISNAPSGNWARENTGKQLNAVIERTVENLEGHVRFLEYLKDMQQRFPTLADNFKEEIAAEEKRIIKAENDVTNAIAEKERVMSLSGWNN